MRTATRVGTGLKSVLAVLGGAAMLLGTLAPLDEAAAAVAPSIKNTRHNLGSTVRDPVIAGANTFSGTDEICVFCHTPHGGASGLSVPPLWNRTMPATAYSVYDTTNSTTLEAGLATDGIAAAPSVGSVSIACLSCHDGSQALNTILNAPGSGYAGDATWAAGTWSGTFTGTLAATSAAMLGADLKNDHPIGIQYCGGGPTVAAAAAACRDGDFVTPSSATIGAAGLVFWVDTTVSGVNAAGRQKTDMVLFNRTFPTDGSGPSVECASCHDVHKDGANSTPQTSMFLRVSNSGSGVCLSCHVK